MKCTNKEYRESPGVSRSDLWHIDPDAGNTPAHFRYHMEHAEEEDPASPAMIFGSAIHKLVLEPESFSAEFSVLPSGIDRRTKAGKEQYGIFLEEANGKTIITEDQYKTALEMSEALLMNEEVKEILCKREKAETEESYFWTDQQTGIRCKVRPDFLRHDLQMIFDYKTTESCNERDFRRSIRKYGYKLQVGMYVEGMEVCTLPGWNFAFFAQEKTAPYLSRVFYLDSDYLNEAHDIFRRDIGILKKCYEFDIWPGFSSVTIGGEADD